MHRTSRVDSGRVQTTAQHPPASPPPTASCTFLATHATCPDCGAPLKLKARGSRSFRTLFGTFKVSSPRLEYCDCKQRKTSSFRPLSALLTELVAPEILYMEAKWSSLVSYGLSLDALQDFLPIDLRLDVKTVRSDTLKVAKRLEAEVGDEQASFIEGDPSDWDLLPPSEGFFKVGIDGGYVRNWFDKKHKFEVIVGKSTHGSLISIRVLRICNTLYFLSLHHFHNLL